MYSFDEIAGFDPEIAKAMTDEKIEKILNPSANSDVPPVKRVTYDIYNLTFAQIKDLIEKSEGDISVHIHIRAVDGD